MSLYNTFSTDPAVETGGLILQLGQNSKGDFVEFRVARAGGANMKYSKVLEFKFRPHQKSLKTLDKKVAERLLIEVYAESIVLGWSGVEDRDGQAMEFTKDNVIKLFTDLPEVFKRVQEAADDFSLFRQLDREEVSGN